MAPHAQYPETDHLSFGQIASLPYKDQAVWVLNGFWEAHGAANAEAVWCWHQQFVELDRASAAPKGAVGSELDAIMSAKFLEVNNLTMTALDRKAALREIDVNNDGKMALVEYLLYSFRLGVDEVVEAKQGQAEEIAAAQAVIDRAVAMMPEVQANLAAQRVAAAEHQEALRALKVAEAESRAALERQAAAEAELQSALKLVADAAAELAAAIAAVVAQEEAIATEITRLEGAVADPGTGVVARGRAANQLHSLRNEDPLPLRKLRLTQEAALRALAKREAVAKAAADEAAAETALYQAKLDELAAKTAEGERREAELAAAVAELEATYAEMMDRMQEAEAAIVALKKDKCGLGAVWWLERELFEADESLPRSRQRYDHSLPFFFAEDDAEVDGAGAGAGRRRGSIFAGPGPDADAIATIVAVEADDQAIDEALADAAASEAVACAKQVAIEPASVTSAVSG